MIGKIEFRVLDVSFRNLDDSRDVILLDVYLPNPHGATTSQSARWVMQVPRGTGKTYYEDHIKPLITKV